MKLFELPAIANEIETELTENYGELTPELELKIIEFVAQGKDKIEAAAAVVQQLEASAEVCKIQAKRLSERSAGIGKSADRLKGLMLDAVDRAFGGKVKTDLYTVWAQKSPDTVHFDIQPDADIADVGEKFIRYAEPELNKIELREALRRGEVLPAAVKITEVPGSRYLRIK